MKQKHPHYFKSVKHLEYIDPYRILKLYEVTDPAIAHAFKKVLMAGQRGAKDIDKDISEAIDTLTRWQEMREEDSNTPSTVKPNFESMWLQKVVSEDE